MIDEPIIRHLYVHVPFCAKKCDYCAFYSEAADGELVNRYVERIDRRDGDGGGGIATADGFLSAVARRHFSISGSGNASSTRCPGLN